MAYTLQQIEALERAAASGVLSVRVGDETVTYQSLKEMRRQLDLMKAELAPAASRAAFITPATGKGY